MPNKLARPCRYRGCAEVTDSKEGYCATHCDNYNKERKESVAFYHTNQWRKLRRWHIGQNPLCVVCGKPGRVVDHIVPIRLGGNQLDTANLQTMCDYHHNQKRGREGAGGV